jgi:hypothetical protein
MAEGASSLGRKWESLVDLGDSERAWSVNSHEPPFAKHPATGSFMRIAVVPRQGRRRVRSL